MLGAKYSFETSPHHPLLTTPCVSVSFNINMGKSIYEHCTFSKAMFDITMLRCYIQVKEFAHREKQHVKYIFKRSSHLIAHHNSCWDIQRQNYNSFRGAHSMGRTDHNGNLDCIIVECNLFLQVKVNLENALSPSQSKTGRVRWRQIIEVTCGKVLTRFLLYIMLKLLCAAVSDLQQRLPNLLASLFLWIFEIPSPPHYFPSSISSLLWGFKFIHYR